MSLTYGFYDSIGGDRKYNAAQMSAIFDGIINDGVFMSIGERFMVSSAEGMNVIVGTGRAWFNSTWTINDADILVSVEPSEVILNRIDAVVLEVDSNEDVRSNTIKVIKGTPSMTPVAPSVIKMGKLNQHLLAYLYIGAGITTIPQANITNKVGTTACPFVTGILEAMNIDSLIAQWESEWDIWMSNITTEASNWTTQQRSDFDTWFADVQAELAGDIAGNLLNLIETHTHSVADISNFPTTMPANGGDSQTVNGHTVYSNVPMNAIFTDTLYTHPTSPGNKHIPTGGAIGQILKYSASGTAVWGSETPNPTSLPANGGNADTVDNFHIKKDTVVPTSLADNLICLVYE